MCVQKLKQILEWISNWQLGYQGNVKLSSELAFNVEITSKEIHPDFESTKFGNINDIALLKLSKNVDFNEGVVPICLPKEAYEEKDLITEPLEVAGWGATGIP